MRLIMGNIFRRDDFIGAGFQPLDEHLIEQHPPEIQWGLLVKDMSPAQRERYLQRLASAMNHAAALVQAERDQLQALLEAKEEKLKAAARAMRTNDAMLQSEVTRLNQDRQEMLRAIADLKAELRKNKAG